MAEGARALRLGASAAAEAPLGAGGEDVFVGAPGAGANHDPPSGGEGAEVAADVGAVAADAAGELSVAGAGDDDGGV